MNKRLLIVFILGFSSGLPMALLGGSLQAWFASSGMSIMATGALSLISFPYVFRALWGPILDRYSLFSLGKRRSWILTMQMLLLCGFNLMAWLHPQQSPHFIAVVALLLACFSATQDVAIDAHRAEYLPVNEHGIGASLAVFGYRFALLVSGGLALIMANHFGWAFTYRVMGLLMFLGMFAVFISPEPSIPSKDPIPFTKAFILPVKELFSRPYALQLFLFIFFYKAAEAFTSTSSGIVMPFLIQGLGFSLDTIGYINKMLGIASTLLGGLIAGMILLRCSLYKSLMAFGLLQALTNVLFVALAMVGKSSVMLALAVVSDNLAAGMGATALVALFMRLVDKRFTGTQFSILVAAASLPRIISGPIAAYIQEFLGWVGLYKLSVLIALLFIPLLLQLREYTEKRRDMEYHSEQALIAKEH